MKYLNEESFKYGFTLFRHKRMKNNHNRRSTIEKYFEGFNFNNIKYPLEKEDYEKIERNNNVCLRVYRPSCNNNKIYTHYESELTDNTPLIASFLDEGRYSYVKSLKFISKHLANN